MKPFGAHCPLSFNAIMISDHAIVTLEPPHHCVVVRVPLVVAIHTSTLCQKAIASCQTATVTFYHDLNYFSIPYQSSCMMATSTYFKSIYFLISFLGFMYVIILVMLIQFKL